MSKVLRPPPRPRSGQPLTRRQASRHVREQRLRKIIISSVVVALLVVIAVPLFGYYREVIAKGNQPVARVDGDPISLDEFTKLYGYHLVSLDGRANQLQQMAAQSQGTNNAFSQQLQRLQTERTNLDTTVLNELIEQRLIASEAAARGIVVSVSDEDARIEKEFGTTPRPTPTVDTAAPAATPPTPVPTVAPLERMRTALAGFKVLNEAEYRQFVVRPALLSERLQDTFAGDGKETEAQISARHILLESEEAAKSAKERLDKGEPFEKLAAELSKDNANKDKGGELGWFGRGKMTKPFEDVAFELPVNVIGDPVKTAFGWHVLQVTARDDNRPLDEEQRNEKRGERFKNWMEKRKDDGFNANTIAYEYSSEKIAWARAQVNKARGPSRNAP